MEKLDYTEWKDTLKEYLDNYLAKIEDDMSKMNAELVAVRKAKEELYEMQRQLQEMACSGRYERDDDTLVLSAPNIIIGNVDKHGNLLSGTSNIVIRGNNVNIEGVGQVSAAGASAGTVTGGCVTTRARTVKVQTVDPGPDGLESVAFKDASFSVQSSAISMSTEKIVNGLGVYTRKTVNTEGSINVTAETAINVTAAQPLSVPAYLTEPGDEGFDKEFAAKIKALKDSSEAEITNVGKKAEELSKNQNNKTLDMLGAAGDSVETIAMRTGLYKFDERAEISESMSRDLAQGVYKACAFMANLAEAKRVKKYITAYKKAVTDDTNGYKKNAESKLTGSSINLRSELIKLRTDKADGELSKIDGNGLDIESQNVRFNVFNGTAPVEDTTFRIVANNVSIDTNKYETALNGTGADATTIVKSTTADGSVIINSKDIRLSTADRTYTQDKANKIDKETVNAESSITLHTFKTNLDMSDNQGAALGEFSLNAKTVNITSCDFKKDDGSATQVAKDGSISINAATIDVGTLNDKQVCGMVQISGDQTNVYGKKLVAIKQEENKSQLKLDANAELGGGETKLTGNITLGGNTKIDCDFTANNVDLKNLNIGTSFKSPNMNDGVTVTIAGTPLDPTKIEERIQSVESKIKFAKDADRRMGDLIGMIKANGKRGKGVKAK